MDTRPQCGKGWADRCANSRGRSCRCRCGGANHGKAHGAQGIGGDTARPKLTDPKVFNRPLERAFVPGSRMQPDIVLRRETPEVGGARVFLDFDDPKRGPDDEAPDRLMPQRLVVHSHGFEWGYAGSGPADLALNILARFTTPQDAYALHQDFKFDVVAKMPTEGGRIRAADVVAWLTQKFAAPAPDGFRVRESRLTSA